MHGYLGTFLVELAAGLAVLAVGAIVGTITRAIIRMGRTVTATAAAVSALTSEVQALKDQRGYPAAPPWRNSREYNHNGGPY